MKLSNMKKTQSKSMCGVLLKKSHIIRQFFFEDHVINADSHLDMLQNYFIPQLEQLHFKDDTVFQQDKSAEREIPGQFY